MAQRSSSGRGGTATRTRGQAGKQARGTPRVSEAEISRMRVDEIRGQLRRHGVSGISALRKPELVRTLAKTLRAERRSGGSARTGTGPAGRATATKRASGRAATTGKKVGRSEKAGRAGKAAAKKAPARGVTGTARPARSVAVRSGPGTSRSVRSSQVIVSLADRPERPGRSLVTTNHDVIRRWARQRDAKPATIRGTEREGRVGVLTFNMPGYRESSRVREITWNEWFRTFDLRQLNLIYQEQLRDGRTSNFFRTESPDREDG